MPDASPSWQLVGFETHVDIWINLENPDQDQINEVWSWVLSRMDDPYQDVQREPAFDNLWFGRIPATVRGGTTAVGSYFVLETGRIVRCNAIATLSLPA